MKILRRWAIAIDRRYLKKAGAASVPGSRYKLLLACYHPYHGKRPVVLPDGVIIQPGELVGEFHLANTRIMEIAAENKPGLQWRLLEMLTDEFTVLAIAAHAGELPRPVRAFYGVNVLPAGARRLGFVLIPIPKGWDRLWLGFWESLLRLVYYSFQTTKKATIRRTMDPYEIWITGVELERRYFKK
jgi:hypothetical protein